MTKKSTIIVSVFLIIFAVVIEVLINWSKTQINDHFSFFAGALSVAGVAPLIKIFFGKKKQD